jgi:hypothetical protein
LLGGRNRSQTDVPVGIENHLEVRSNRHRNVSMTSHRK